MTGAQTLYNLGALAGAGVAAGLYFLFVWQSKRRR